MLVKAIFFPLLFFPIMSFGLTYNLPSPGSSVIGEVHEAVVKSFDDITAIGERNDVGVFELADANPKKNIDHLLISESLTVPSRYILPATPRKGIVINLAELRLYYYAKDGTEVMTFPVGIGRKGEETPLLNTKIIEKKVNPRWFPSKSTRLQAREQGIVLPRFVESGPDNPLGDFAMRLGSPEYLIHGTHDPTGVGIRSSAGCIRMYPEDVKKLFALVKVGTRVRIINEPFKVGFNGNKLELESHVPLDHKQGEPMTAIKIQALNKVLMPFVKKHHVEVNWDAALSVAKAETGIPAVIGYQQSLSRASKVSSSRGSTAGSIKNLS